MALCPCLQDDDARESLRISQAIDRELSQFRRESAREFKLLLLGTDEVGKSTFIKQMRIIYGQGYSDRDRDEFKTLIFRDIVRGILIMIEAMQTLKIPYTNEACLSHIAQLQDMDPESIVDITEQQFEGISTLWADEGTKKCFEMRINFQISDSAKHYFDSLDRIRAEGYIPSLDDMLRVTLHYPTPGIVEYSFQMRKEVVFRMVDVGGQRSGRRKWIHYFEGITILFITAISEYDEVLAEDISQNRMRENLALFKTIMSYPLFKYSDIILFLDKTDLFMEKIGNSPLSTHFPEYREFQYRGEPAKDHDADAAKEFIKTLFASVNPDPENKTIFFHFTNMTDTMGIKRVFEHVQEHLLQQSLSQYHLL